MHGMKRDLGGTFEMGGPFIGETFAIRPPSNLGPPVIQGPKVPYFSPSILHIIHWNSPNIEIDEGQIWV